MSEGNQGVAIFFNQTFVRTSSGMQIIDVRDLASVHVALLEQQKSGPYMVSGHFRSWDELADVLDRVTGRKMRKYAIPGPLLRALGSAVDQVGKYIDVDTIFSAEAAMYASQWVYVDDRKVRREFGLDYRPLEVTLRDTIRWLAEAGHIEPYWAARLERVSRPVEST